jgi:hypothetical protein
LDDIRWSPFFSWERIMAVSAAIPDEKESPASPPSRDFIFSMNAACVGVLGEEWMYLYPGTSPENMASACSALLNKKVDV